MDKQSVFLNQFAYHTGILKNIKKFMTPIVSQSTTCVMMWNVDVEIVSRYVFNVPENSNEETNPQHICTSLHYTVPIKAAPNSDRPYGPM